MIKDKKKSNILTYIILYAIFFTLHYVLSIGMDTSGFYVSDMAGYIGNARMFLYGYGFPSLHCHIYYPGYSFLLIPALWIAKNDFGLSYKLIQLTNSLLLSFMPILIYQLTEIFKPSLEKKMKILITIVASCYPTYLVYSNLIMSESIVFPLVLLLTIMVYRLSQNSDKYFYWITLPICYGYLYLCTPRALTLLPALIIALFLIAFKNKQYKKFAISLLLFIPGFLITTFFVNKLNLFLAQSYLQQTEVGNSYGAGSFAEIFNLPMSNYFFVFCAQLLYLIFSTYGFILIGLAFLFDKIKIKYFKADETYIFNLFIILSFLSTWLLSTIYSALYVVTLDQLIYGRYNEMIIAPILIAGILAFLNNSLNVKTKILLVITAIIVFTLTYFKFAGVLLKFDRLNIHVLGIEFYRFFSKDFNLISSALIFLCATTIIFITGLKNKMVSLIVLLIIFIATSGIIYKGFKEYTIKEKNNSQLIEALKIYSSKNSKVIINFDISQEYFTYAESAIPVRDDSNETSIAFFNKFFPIINEFYKYQLYFPHIKVNRIDSQLKDKPASDLILSSENNLFEIYPGAKIVAIDGVENPKMVNMKRFYNLKLWLLPGKNYNCFNAN